MPEHDPPLDICDPPLQLRPLLDQDLDQLAHYSRKTFVLGCEQAGSDQIEKVFESYYTMIGEPFTGTDFSGRSDYGPFILAGIPSGGLFTGAEGIKTAAEAALWGGTAGQQYDPCYHLACDTYANVNLFALDVNADAVAYAVLQFAMNTHAINGKRGKGNFKFDYWGPQPKE